MTGPDANTQDPRPPVTTHPLLGVAGVLLGALIATCTSRLMGVGLADIRGALLLGVDEGSWINTAFNASMGPFSVYLGGLLGPRRVHWTGGLRSASYSGGDSSAFPAAQFSRLLATVVTIPSFLGSVRGFLPLQEARVMAWVALPQFVLGIAAMAFMRRIDPRLILTVGFGLVGVACLLDARVTSVRAGLNFGISQAVMAVGLALAFNSMVGAIVLEIIDTCGLTRPADVLTFAGFFQVTRLFGGEMGSTFMGHFIAVREEFHSNMLGLNVQLGNRLTDSRLLDLQRAFAPHSTSHTAMGRAAEVLGLQVRQQAYTLAISDSFLLLATCCVVCLVVVSFMSEVPTQYRNITAAPVEAK